MQKDIYTWAAIYRDDGFIQEYDASCPEGHGFAEVDGTRVKEFKLESQDERLKSHYVQIPEGATPVFFRRRKIATNPATGQHERSTVAHCIGWKRGQQECYLFVLEDGSTLLTSNLQAV